MISTPSEDAIEAVKYQSFILLVIAVGASLYADLTGLFYKGDSVVTMLLNSGVRTAFLYFCGFYIANKIYKKRFERQRLNPESQRWVFHARNRLASIITVILVILLYVLVLATDIS